MQAAAESEVIIEVAPCGDLEVADATPPLSPAAPEAALGVSVHDAAEHTLANQDILKLPDDVETEAYLPPPTANSGILYIEFAPPVATKIVSVCMAAAIMASVAMIIWVEYAHGVDYYYRYNPRVARMDNLVTSVVGLPLITCLLGTYVWRLVWFRATGIKWDRRRHRLALLKAVELGAVTLSFVFWLLPNIIHSPGTAGDASCERFTSRLSSYYLVRLTAGNILLAAWVTSARGMTVYKRGVDAVRAKATRAASKAAKLQQRYMPEATAATAAAEGDAGSTDRPSHTRTPAAGGDRGDAADGGEEGGEEELLYIDAPVFHFIKVGVYAAFIFQLVILGHMLALVYLFELPIDDGRLRLMPEACIDWYTSCDHSHYLLRTMQITLSVSYLLYLFLYGWQCYVAARHLRSRSYARMRSLHLCLQLEVRIRGVAVAFMVVVDIVTTSVTPDNCSVAFDMLLGGWASQVVLAAMVCSLAFLAMPFRLDSRLPALRETLQAFAWTEASLPERKAALLASLPLDDSGGSDDGAEPGGVGLASSSTAQGCGGGGCGGGRARQRPVCVARAQLQQEPMFCFETALKLTYWCEMAYYYDEPGVDPRLPLPTLLDLYGLHEDRMQVVREEATDSKAIIAQGENLLLVCFRGTASLRNACIDLQARLVPYYRRMEWKRRLQSHHVAVREHAKARRHGGKGASTGGAVSHDDAAAAAAASASAAAGDMGAKQGDIKYGSDGAAGGGGAAAGHAAAGGESSASLEALAAHEACGPLKRWLTEVSSATASVHRGFQKSWTKNGFSQRVLEAVGAFLKEYPTGGRVMVTGHSLGGAQAILCALDIAYTYSLPRSQLACYTFGVPRVGDRGFASLYDSSGVETWNIINGEDVVPLSPKYVGWFVYKHPGLKVVINKHGDIVVRPDIVEGVLLRTPFARSVSNHLLGSYLTSQLSVLASQLHGTKHVEGGVRGLLHLASRFNLPELRSLLATLPSILGAAPSKANKRSSSSGLDAEYQGSSRHEATPGALSRNLRVTHSMRAAMASLPPPELQRNPTLFYQLQAAVVAADAHQTQQELLQEDQAQTMGAPAQEPALMQPEAGLPAITELPYPGAGEGSDDANETFASARTSFSRVSSASSGGADGVATATNTA